jgi:type IV pilus assembly protein PilX
MNCKDPFRPTPSPRLQREKGVALVVALILLVVMTLLGLGAMRSVTLEEKMAANTFDRSLSFQAAEASLREAESLLDTPTPPTPAAGSACVAGICGAPAANATPRWLDSTFVSGTNGWQPATPVVSGSISITPEYFIEYLGASFPCQPNDISSPASCKRYRVTVRSNAGADRAAVMLQSIYAAP